MTIPIALQDNKLRADFPYIVNKMPQAQQISISPYANLTRFLIQHALDVPPLGIGISVLKNDTVLALFNGAGYHAPPLVLNLISNAIVKEEPGKLPLLHRDPHSHYYHHPIYTALYA